MDRFEKRLLATASRVSDALDDQLASQRRQGEISRPERLMSAMRHGALNGGKRLRPFLVLETAALFGVSENEAMPAALAVECVHCYSLIHDDLPAMDDDDLRRGQPTVHKAFDEATAILAGDGLLTLAFELLGDDECHHNAAIRCELVVELARSAGLGGMVGGQMLDLQASVQPPNDAAIRTLQAMKTGALLRFACEAGAILGGAATAERAVLRAFGEKTGQAFQLADDILDVVSSDEAMGKRVGKDVAMGKGTLVATLGLEGARQTAERLVEEADALLDGFGDRADVLKSCARYIVSRNQ
ncbi:polyprenyl synthetase family protein [Salaquimonas pukyongi]|uniref:polyprenyl synthetase family protein n=1 Tax=Salaquimonas pukyongi TaxID=2712698 RepID=UPI00096B77EE|nr:farnesyl diphosphate synthase [Salaquimonas pukyongi]